MTPFNPSPYVAVYVPIVFILPWAIYSSYIIRTMIRSYQLGVELFSLETGFKIRELRKTDPILKSLHQKTKKWFVIVLLMWVGGFALLGTTLYKLDEANLLINHSKGIYGPNEHKESNR